MPPPPAPPPPPTAAVHRHGDLLPIIAAASSAAVLSIFLTLLISFLLYRRCRRNRTSPSDLKPPLSLPTSAASFLRRFSYSHLRRATSSFSPSHKLGQGGFGPVFRGSLPNSHDIAVKLMDSGSLQGEREFQNELSLAAKFRSGPPSCSSSVVVPLGFCIEERDRKWWQLWRNNDVKCEDEEVVVGSGGGFGKRVLLVYELMHNGSLQDALLRRKSPELCDWGRRFRIAVDIAKGIQFLHDVCDPAVIHGDIKPSNILLDSRFCAKIADFGLARVKVGEGGDAAQVEGEEEEVVVVVDVDLRSGNDRKKELLVVEDDGSVMGETVAESTTTIGIEADDGGFMSTPEGNGNDLASPSVGAIEVASTSEVGGYDRMSVDSGRKVGGRKKGGGMGKDWWWRQDNGGVGNNGESGGSVKDYVMEWIRSEIKKERPKSDWITEQGVLSEDCLPRNLGRSDRKKQQRRLEWWASLDEDSQKKKRSRPAREWWREEFCEELTKKQQRKQMITKSKSNVEGGQQPQWWQEDEDCTLPSERKKRRKKNSSSQASMDYWGDGFSGEMKRTRTGRRSSVDWGNGTEIPKSGGTVSSTPSMRGTVCYVAPEYGGGGSLSEKCDIYSFGVLLLVLISGRRPLQVTASPMSEFERANLISWARHLAHLGRLLEILDPTLKAVGREQALLCITVALLCIQRSPASRPSIKEIVGMLTGESELPNLPFEFSPSPPGGFSFKSRKKSR